MDNEFGHPDLVEIAIVDAEIELTVDDFQQMVRSNHSLLTRVPKLFTGFFALFFGLGWLSGEASFALPTLLFVGLTYALGTTRFVVRRAMFVEQSRIGLKRRYVVGYNELLIDGASGTEVIPWNSFDMFAVRNNQLQLHRLGLDVVIIPERVGPAVLEACIDRIRRNGLTRRRPGAESAFGVLIGLVAVVLLFGVLFALTAGNKKDDSLCDSGKLAVISEGGRLTCI